MFPKNPRWGVLGGMQCPFGLAVFDGSFARLAERMERPPLMQWAPSHYASVDGGIAEDRRQPDRGRTDPPAQLLV